MSSSPSTPPSSPLTLRVPPSVRNKTNRGDRTRRFANDQTVVIASDYRQDQIRLIEELIASGSLSTSQKQYWKYRLADIISAPTGPPSNFLLYFFLLLK